MRRTLIILGTLLVTTLLVLGACAPTPTPTPVPAPAKFKVISLDVVPPEVIAGETVSITAVVENIGGSEGTYAVTLTVDGVNVETKEVAITPGSSKVVNFSLVKDAPSTYEIGIGGLSSSLTVKEKPAPERAEFKVISLDVVPPEVIAGETVSITAVVENIGGGEGSYAVILSLDGFTEKVKETGLMTPGSSIVVTFSIVKYSPSTYEIGVGGLSSSLTVKEKITLKYDSGEFVAFTSQGPGWGYSVHFSPSAIPFTVSKVQVMAELYLAGCPDCVASLEIWDEDFNVLYSHEMPATKFSEEPRWVTVETNISVDGDFRVVFFPNSGGQEGGIAIGYDLSGNKASEVVKTGGVLVDWPASWETGSYPKPEDKINWMVRVVGG